MFDIYHLVGAGAIALIIGLYTGWMLGQRRNHNREAVLDLRARLEHSVSSRADYEAEVTEHFNRTAQLLGKMTQDYREVYNHLASGADNLCDGAVDIPPASLERRADDAELPPHVLNVTQPLDYAPRRDPSEQGQLSETFGIEKASTGGSSNSGTVSAANS